MALTIVEQAAQIDELLLESPSLRARLLEFAQPSYRRARREAEIETGLPIGTFPELPETSLAALDVALKEASSV